MRALVAAFFFREYRIRHYDEYASERETAIERKLRLLRQDNPARLLRSKSSMQNKTLCWSCALQFIIARHHLKARARIVLPVHPGKRKEMWHLPDKKRTQTSSRPRHRDLRWPPPIQSSAESPPGSRPISVFVVLILFSGV